jgi:hypothetical protein
MRVLCKNIRLSLQHIRQPFIVGIQKGDPVSRGGLNTGISCRAGAGVFLLNQCYFIPIGTHRLDGVVRGAIVNDDDLIGRMCLI